VLDGLAGDIGDDLEVFPGVQDGQPGQFSRGGDDQVWYRGGTVLAAVGEQGQDFGRAVLNGRG
jgi:hypothetical protein